MGHLFSGFATARPNHCWRAQQPTAQVLSTQLPKHFQWGLQEGARNIQKSTVTLEKKEKAIPGTTFPSSRPDFDHILYSSSKMTSHDPNPKLLSALAYAYVCPLNPQCHPSGSGFISWQTIRIWKTRMRSKVIYRMSSNWQAPPLFFNALGMIYILIPNKGAWEVCLNVLGQDYTHRDHSQRECLENTRWGQVYSHCLIQWLREIGSRELFTVTQT